MKGFTATVKIGVNAETKEEAKKEVLEWIKILECPIWLEDIK